MESLHPDTQVLIVGAGLAGLTTAIVLGTYNIKTILIERRAEASQHPRADGFTARTVEIFRSFDIGADIVPETAPSFKTKRTRVMSLSGQWFEELAWNEQEKSEPATTPTQPEYSPYHGSSIPQDKLEPILIQRAIELGVDVRMGHEFIGLAQDSNSVTTTIRNNENGLVYLIKAPYLVAADGHRSAIREILEIPRKGHGPVNSIQSVLFRAPELSPYLNRGFKQFTIDQPDLRAFMIAYQDERLVLHLPNDREWTNESIEKAVLQSVGPEKVTLEILATSRWDMSAWIANDFIKGRVFLVGDAAHSLPPNRGGYGANTGIADGHNLAWKLAHVIHGMSSDKLLMSYQTERLPVAWLRHDQIFSRADYKTLQREPSLNNGSGGEQEALPDAAVEFGQIYRSDAVIEADKSLPDALLPELWKGQPGTRLPHCWIQHDGEDVSSIQLHSGAWRVLSEDPEWADIVQQVQLELGIQGKFIHVQQSADTNFNFGKVFGVSKSGCVLVRPDCYIAWRVVDVGVGSDSKARLEEAWKAVLCWKRD